jgi:MYXO-CTERM domain-containing protein
MTEHSPRRRAVPGDPSGIEQPHDVLAADEFGIGTRDQRVPPDPTGISEPHDVLAAEEFAMPAGAEPHDRTPGRPAPGPRTVIPLVLLAALAALLLLRRRT